MNTLRVFFFMFLLTALLAVAGELFGGRQGLIMALIFAGIMNLGSYLFSDKIVLAMYRAKPVTEAQAPELYSLIQTLASRAGLPMPKIAIIPQAQPNAFATGRDHHHAVVAVTTGILESMNRDELEGVLAHELAHIKNYDMLIGTIAATMAGAIAFLPRIFLFSGGSRDREGAGNALALIAMIILPIAALLIKMAMSRAKEFRADRVGAEISGNPRGLASALAKLGQLSRRVPLRGSEATSHLFIVHPFSGGMASWFSTHPPIPERIKRLEAMAVGGK
ncbi:MAG TPA: zinc metalloprotease HtpX [Thermoanaerobaculia bacterium]|nr:zinc metalloprotease HtpX [Thermoanaerobaculia bacterium]HUM30269.1 zinc metalloprotease HtpX [Thermoanaerobaculia bacterium]HXK68435.1 zinc metalloprotease HtpX [Thermoanaerobaculia bacterium]